MNYPESGAGGKGRRDFIKNTAAAALLLAAAGKVEGAVQAAGVGGAPQTGGAESAPQTDGDAGLADGAESASAAERSVLAGTEAGSPSEIGRASCRERVSKQV